MSSGGQERWWQKCEVQLIEAENRAKQRQIHMQVQQERGVSASPSTSEWTRKRAGPAAEITGK